MKQKIEQLFSDIFFDLDLTDEQAKILHKHEQELLKEVEKQALNIPVVVVPKGTLCECDDEDDTIPMRWICTKCNKEWKP